MRVFPIVMELFCWCGYYLDCGNGVLMLSSLKWYCYDYTGEHPHLKNTEIFRREGP